MVKKVFLFLTVFILVFSLGACKKNSPEQTASSQAEQSVESNDAKADAQSPDALQNAGDKSKEADGSQGDTPNNASPKSQPEHNGGLSDATSLTRCTLEIKCENALKSKDLPKTIADILPKDGCILNEEVTFDPGESAMDVFMRVCRQKDIPVKFSGHGDSSFIESISHLRNGVCGELSGWLWSLNGKFGSESAGAVEVSVGDKILFVYSCDLGADCGASFEQ